jgi:hypothetical protein
MANVTQMTIFGLIAAFSLKHFIADFLLQTAWMVREKGIYGRLGGIAHAGLHGLCSLAVLALFGLPASLIVALAALETALHYHIDYGKERLARHLGDTPADHRFWILLGFDQLLHHLTYAAMIIAALDFGT